MACGGRKPISVNPYFGRYANTPESPETNTVFRAFRYSEDEITHAKQASSQ